MVRLGVHIDQPDPPAQATARGADAVQFFLGDPQGWKGPVVPGDPAGLKASFAAADTAAYIHAPYVVNVATTNNRIRIPSRKIPLLIENTAGGTNAMARTLDAISRLWDAVTAGISGGEGDGQVGFCLDTCHANSAGLDLAGVVDKIKAITGRIDLVHCNNSRDPFGSSRDRHANLTSGTIDPELILGVVRAAGAPLVCETPDTDGSLAGDVSWLRGHLAGG